VGRYPFGITLSPDERYAYVANVGMYEYKLLENVDVNNLKENAIDYPPFAYLSPQSRDGIYNDSMRVPGLGDPNTPESFSVWAIQLNKEKPPRVTSKIKTGILVGQIVEDFPAVGGASPNSVVATDRYVFVSNGNNDCISVIDVKQDTVVNNIYLQLDERLGNLRGIIPFGLALSPDHKRLYVAESGINAVAVIDVPTLRTIGHIPVAWFPSKLAVSPDGKELIVANAKGFGSGPNAGPDFEEGPEGSYVGNLMNGTVSILDIPSDEHLQQETAQVISNNFNFIKSENNAVFSKEKNPIPLYTGEKESPIKHIVFISKENRTYDEVFGQIEQGRGMPGLARYGYHASFTNKDQKRRVEDATVMPNHLKLAKQFAISDNFYCDSDHSADGHRWLVNTYPNEWVETSVSASYGGGRGMRSDSEAPGNFALVGATGAIYPEDYNEAGSIWEHFERHNIDFFDM
jgi:YVTN family beta-propeller protein